MNPLISVIIPTFNEENRLTDCLKSIQNQDYPKNRVEILIVDDLSTDKTIEIAKKFKAKILINGTHHIERGKSISLAKARGEFVFFIDADNRLTSDQWFKESIKIFQENKNIVGVEGWKVKYKKQDSLVNRYCALFGVTDPLVFYLGKRGWLSIYENNWYEKKAIIRNEKDYFITQFNLDNLPTLGSNGYMTKKSLLKKTNWQPYLFHMDSIYELVAMGYTNFGRVRFEIEHDFARNVFDMMGKWQRNIKLFWKYQDNRKYKYQITKMKLLLTLLKITTLIIPIIDSIKGYYKKRDVAWFLHPILSLAVVIIYAKSTVEHTNNFFKKLFLATILGALPYLILVNSYFIQDEWQFFSILKVHNSFLEQLKFFIAPTQSQYTPISSILAASIYKLFGLNFEAYFIFGLILHLMVGFVLGLLIYKITKREIESLFGVIFFLIVPQHFQATSWVVANIGYSASAFLFLIGLIFFFDWLKKDSWKSIFLSGIFLLLSLLSKEITIFILIALPILSYLWTKQIKIAFKSFCIVSPVFIFGLWHYLFLKQNTLNLTVNDPLNLRNVLLLPVRSLAQSLVPVEWIYSASNYIVSLTLGLTKLQPHTTSFDIAVETKGALMVITAILLFVMALYCRFFILNSNKKDLIFKNIFLTGIFLTALSSLSFVFVDPFKFSLLQPRYTYIGVIGMSIAISAFLTILNNKYGSLSLKIFSLILIIYFCGTFILSYNLTKTSLVRKDILESIQASLPVNSKDTIIFVQSDKSYYGLPDNVKIPPFQNGLGKVLAVYLDNKIYIPSNVYKPEALWSIDSQGYYSDQSGGFGYFRSYNKLSKTVKENDLNINDIYAFKFISDENRLVDITKKTRLSWRS